MSLIAVVDPRETRKGEGKSSGSSNFFSTNKEVLAAKFTFMDYLSFDLFH